MDDHVEKMAQTFPKKLNSTEMEIAPSGNNLFDNGNGKSLGKSKSEYFHMMVAKALFLSKTAMPTYSLKFLYWLLG